MGNERTVYTVCTTPKVTYNTEDCTQHKMTMCSFNMLGKINSYFKLRRELRNKRKLLQKMCYGHFTGETGKAVMGQGPQDHINTCKKTPFF